MTCYVHQLGYYPAAGYRANGTGGFGTTSTGGYYWSASQAASATIYSSNLRIDGSYIRPNITAERAVGLSVRCVAAF